jgi:hypothetical protein
VNREGKKRSLWGRPRRKRQRQNQEKVCRVESCVPITKLCWSERKRKGSVEILAK